MKNKKDIPAIVITLVVAVLLAGPVYSQNPASAAGGRQAEGLKEACRLSLEGILKALHDYDYASGVGPLEKLHVFVMTHKDDPAARAETETRLLDFIRSAPNAGGLLAACRGLRIIGSPASVPVLGPLLLDAGAADAARYALEKVPGPEADAALVSALGRTTGALRLGIISSLGMRGVAQAVGPLSALAGGKDERAAVASVQALGRIGNVEAEAALEPLLGRPSGPIKEAAASAVLSLAQTLEKSGRTAQAAVLYDAVREARPSKALRLAAVRGHISTAGPASARKMIVEILKGRESVLHPAALAMVPVYFTETSITELTPLFAGLPEESRVEYAGVLSRYSGPAARDALSAAVADPSPLVRMEAVRGLGRIGDVSSVGLLARTAASSSGTEQALARVSLSRLKGRDIDREIAALLTGTTDEALKAELIAAAGDRRAAEAEPALMAIVASSKSPVQSRLKAAAALGNLAAASEVPGLISLLFSLDDETVEEAMEAAAASAASSDPRIAGRSGFVSGLFRAETDQRRKVVLLRVLGRIGDDASLGVVRGALNDAGPDVRTAAVRALAAWPTTAARDDCLALASSPPGPDPAGRVLALRGFIRMVGLEPHRAPEAAVADLEKAVGLAERAEEKKLALGALSAFPCEKALKLAMSLASDQALKDEVEAAAEKISKALGKY